ncbi:hypothetical protein BWZ20_10285 [Winogradskyella sp. J14-2]|uniref:hypothetical protein n=1 Tax=Winogradskyella sp. J14-2 TaxID=1936080 RepID=UPI000972D9B1|nr:hypothetical protein [Winogradskyella sp. J14-2]APY08666.1 hypothetical protein BWZ20_10285 [Winogradskyella sp. J14-2]
MKKRIFSLLAVVLFAGSLMSIASTKELEETDCFDKVELMITQADRAGWSATELTWLSNAAEAVHCYGYSWDDIWANNY